MLQDVHFRVGGTSTVADDPPNYNHGSIIPKPIGGRASTVHLNRFSPKSSLSMAKLMLKRSRLVAA